MIHKHYVNINWIHLCLNVTCDQQTWGGGVVLAQVLYWSTRLLLYLWIIVTVMNSSLVSGIEAI